MTSVSNKVAFVTGAASGIGFGIAAALARRGTRVVLADVEAGALARACEQLERSGAEVLAQRLDVTDRGAFAAARDAAIARFGAVQLLFNNAGVNADGPLDRVTYQDWDWVLGVNLGGVVNGLTTFLPELKRHGRAAHVVNTASVGGLVGMRGLGVYNASKFAVVGLSEALRDNLQAGRAAYGKQILATLSQELTAEFGAGFSYTALTRMAQAIRWTGRERAWSQRASKKTVRPSNANRTRRQPARPKGSIAWAAAKAPCASGG